MNDSTHDKAMRNVHQQVLERLLAHMDQAQRASLQLLMQRLLVIAGGPRRLDSFRTFVLHGDDRRSAHLLAFLRAAQLSLALRCGRTFQLRVLAARAPGLDSAALARHEQCFGALFLHDDPRVELLRADAGHIAPYSARPAASTDQRKAARNAWLLFGHLSGGRPEALLGARAYLELATALDQALNLGSGVDVLFTLMPLQQRLRLMAWGRRCLRTVTEAAPAGLPHGVGVLAEGLMQVHGLLAMALKRPPRMPQRKPCGTPVVLSLEDLLDGLPEDAALGRMLGYEQRSLGGLQGLFDVEPLAHVGGLQAQYIDQRSYRHGSQEVYRRHGHSPLGARHDHQLQAVAQEHLADAYGVTPEQLVCQAFVPFAERGRQLEAFVQRCHPRMRIALPYLHRALQGRPCPAPVTQWLVDVSGLELAQMRALYAGALRPQVTQLVQALGRRDALLRLLPSPLPATGAGQEQASG